jgi:hypothetical protein
VLRPANEASTINDRQVDILRSLNQDAQVAISDPIQLAFLSPTEGVLVKSRMAVSIPPIKSAPASFESGCCKMCNRILNLTL